MSRLLLLFLATVLLALGVGVVGETAGVDVSASYAGAYSWPLYHPQASNVVYHADATDPSLIDSVSFTITPADAYGIYVKPSSVGGWYSCVNTSGAVSCDTTSPQLTKSAQDMFEMTAAPYSG